MNETRAQHLQSRELHRRSNERVAVDYARGLMGGMLVGVPVMMTMEMWWEGFFVPATRLLTLWSVSFVVLLILQHFSGLTHGKSRGAQIMAALVAYGIGVVASATGLYILGVLRGGIQLRDLAGKLVLEAVPVSIGASVAMSAFGNDHRLTEQRRQEAGYWGMMGMALAGAMLFGFGVSGTEEVLLIADQLTWSRALLLMAVSVIQVYAIVYVVDFKQRPQEVGTARHVVEVARETISTYALSLLVGAYLLWTFRTLDGKTGAAAAAYAVVTIGFVTSLGAAAADLLI